MEPDDIMLRNTYGERGITPPWDALSPLADVAAFASDGSGITIDPHPYVKLEAPDGRPGIEVGIRGTF